MARVADGFRPAGFASLLLHGGAVVAMLVGLPRPPAPPLPQVIEMAFLPAVEELAPVEAAPEAPQEAPREAPAEVSPAPVMEEVTTEQIAETPAPPEPVQPQVAATPMVPHPAPAPRAKPPRPRAMPSAAPSPPAPAPVSAPSAPPPPPRAVPQSYIAALFAALDRRKEYPESARWRRAEGTAILRVALHRDGSVQAWRIERGSGHEDLDQAIGAMVRRASPLPAPPAELAGETVEFTIPVRFSLR